MEGREHLVERPARLPSLDRPAAFTVTVDLEHLGKGVRHPAPVEPGVELADSPGVGGGFLLVHPQHLVGVEGEHLRLPALPELVLLPDAEPGQHPVAPVHIRTVATPAAPAR